MRYLEFDETSNEGHLLVTTVIEQLGLKCHSEPFNTTHDPLFYLRERNFYSSQISSFTPAPYKANQSLAESPPDQVFSYVAAKALGDQKPATRTEQCKFYQEGKVTSAMSSEVFKEGDSLKNIGYWNLMFDQLGSEGYQYASDGGGYGSNVINWNSADAVIYNGEFAPGGAFKTLNNGYSSIFSALFDAIDAACTEKNISWNYHPHTRLRSIYLDADNSDRVTFTLATFNQPLATSDTQTTDYAFLAMPPGSLQIVAEASRYSEKNIVDVLNHEQVATYREAVTLQPSYKVAMFFKEPWWTKAKYAPKLEGKNVFGPTITDTPLRQVYYFGNNGSNTSEPVYSLLASYDDEQFIHFWQEMETPVTETRKQPLSYGIEPLNGPQKAPKSMENMLREQLAQVHWGPQAEISQVPPPLETVFVDWSQKPFSAGYHAWAAHYNISDVMQKIRQPTQLIDGVDAGIYIVGSAYSNDQAWVEGAFCTSESVLNDFFNIAPIVENPAYPFICKCCD
ncbi:MAG: hypothetical protein AAFP03_00330 [Cyanobacteria bacterium J06598_3]